MTSSMRRLTRLTVILLALVTAWPALSQGLTLGVTTGPVTGLPMPRYVSIKASEAYARRGPAFNQRIDWVYNLSDLPVAITAEYGHWRRVEDVDGQGGWVHYTLLSGARSVIVTAQDVTLRSRAAEDAQAVAKLAQGRVALVRECGPVWCRLRTDGVTGWTTREGLWGVGPGEIIE